MIKTMKVYVASLAIFLEILCIQLQHIDCAENDASTTDNGGIVKNKASARKPQYTIEEIKRIKAAKLRVSPTMIYDDLEHMCNVYFKLKWTPVIPKKTKSRDDLDENMPITESENGLVEDTSPKFSSCEKIKPQYEALNTKLTWFRWNSGMELERDERSPFKYTFYKNDLGFPNYYPDAVNRLQKIVADLMYRISKDCQVVCVPVKLAQNWILGYAFSMHAMVIAVWTNDDIERKHGFLYITTSGTAKFFNNGDLEKYIEDTFPILGTRRPARMGYPPNIEAPKGIDAYAKALNYSGEIFRYLDIDWTTFLQLIPSQTSRGFFNLKF